MSSLLWALGKECVRKLALFLSFTSVHFHLFIFLTIYLLSFEFCLEAALRKIITLIHTKSYIQPPSIQPFVYFFQCSMGIQTHPCDVTTGRLSPGPVLLWLFISFFPTPWTHRCTLLYTLFVINTPTIYFMTQELSRYLGTQCTFSGVLYLKEIKYNDNELL
jgi:hypothetical protein